MQEAVSENKTATPGFLNPKEGRLRRAILEKGPSPLYGEQFQQQLSEHIDVQKLHQPENINALQYAASVYEDELSNKGYTALTINSYISAVNRFIDFLEVGQVVPDFDNKPQH